MRHRSLRLTKRAASTPTQTPAAPATPPTSYDRFAADMATGIKWLFGGCLALSILVTALTYAA